MINLNNLKGENWLIQRDNKQRESNKKFNFWLYIISLTYFDSLKQLYSYFKIIFYSNENIYSIKFIMVKKWILYAKCIFFNNFLWDIVVSIKD